MAAAAHEFPVNEDGWPLAPDGYELLVEIGQGAFAKVIKARCPSKDTFVAVKIMALENITTSLEEIHAEVRTMKLSKHENVLDLHCCFVVKSDLWLVMPHMDKGSCYYALRMLRKLGKLHDGQGLSEEVIATILREVLAGLEYIHGQHQIHRDVKAGNILLNSEGRVAIADFGVAGWLSEAGARSEGERKTFVGTPCWMAPEVRPRSWGCRPHQLLKTAAGGDAGRAAVARVRIRGVPRVSHRSTRCEASRVWRADGRSITPRPSEKDPPPPPLPRRSWSSSTATTRRRTCGAWASRRWSC